MPNVDPEECHTDAIAPVPELSARVAELAGLEDQLAKARLAYLERQDDLHRIAVRQSQCLGPLYLRLDELKATAAGLVATINPSGESDRSARQAEEQAQETRETLGQESQLEAPPSHDPETAQAVRDAFLRLVKKIHPDLSTDPDERQRRTDLMAEANVARERGDLRALEDLEARATALGATDSQGSMSERLFQLSAQIDAARSELRNVNEQIDVLERSELGMLLQRVLSAELDGRDLFASIKSRLETEIEAWEREVERLQRMCDSQHEDVP